MSRRLTRVLVGALLVALVAHAEDKWYELYQDGVKAIQNRKWAEAEKKLKAAITSGPVSGRQVRMYGVRFIDYLPEYELGIAYFNQQRYTDALEQFAKVQAAGYVTKTDPEFPSLTDMVELCRIRTAGIVKPPDNAQKQGDALARSARDLMARGNLDEARRVLDSPEAKSAGGVDVTAAREELVRLETEKRMQQERAANDLGRAEQDRAIESAARAAEAGRLDEARAQLAKLPAAAASDPRVKDLRAEIEFRQGVADVSALIAAKKWAAAEERRQKLAVARPGRPEIADLAARIERGRAPATAASPEPASNLEGERSAYVAFYSGRYADAALRFDALASAAPAARRPRLLAYAACARAGDALLKGAAAAPDLAAARKAYAEAGPAAMRAVERDGLVSPGIVRALSGARP